MTTVTLWILITASSGYRPPVVVDRFNKEIDCLVVMEQIKALDGTRAYCLRAAVAR